MTGGAYNYVVLSFQCVSVETLGYFSFLDASNNR